MHWWSRTFLLPWRLSNSSYGREGSGGTDQSESDDKGVHHLTVQVVIGLINVIDSINWFDRLQLLLINTINTINDLVCCVYQSTVTVVTVSGSVRYSSTSLLTFCYKMICLQLRIDFELFQRVRKIFEILLQSNFINFYPEKPYGSIIEIVRTRTF